MPFFTSSPERIKHLFDIFNEGGFEQAQINDKSDFHYYTTELEDIGPSYVMDDFGNAHIVTIDMWVQTFWIYPPLAELT